MATIVDVAKLAGVSTSTVSHVLNHTRPVAPETRNRVLRAISEVGYQKNTIASALRKSQTDTLALVVSEAGYPVLDEIMIGVEDEARALSKTVLIAHSGDDSNLEYAAVSAFSEHRVDGLLIMPVANSLVLERTSHLHVPTVILDRFIDMDVDQVGAANSAPMMELVDHLYSLGHRRICFVARGKPVSTLIERRDAFRAAMRALGLDPDEFCLSSPDASTLRGQLKPLLTSASGPSALVCASQTSAVDAISACNESGISIPEDLSLVTFDEFPFPDLFSPRITAVVQPAADIGHDAVKLLQNRIVNPDSPYERRLISPKVIYRNSTARVSAAPTV